MEKQEIRATLESLYNEYYDGLYSEEQLKAELKTLYLGISISADEWSELILDAQWKNASEKDYLDKKIQIAQESNRGGDVFFCKCGGLLLVKEIEQYPNNLNGEDKLDFERSCIATCSDCGEKYKDLMFD